MSTAEKQQMTPPPEHDTVQNQIHIVKSEIKGHVRPGGFWKRFAATIVDGIVISLAMVPVSFAVGFALSLVAAMGSGGQIDENSMQGIQIISTLISYLFTFTFSFFYFGWFYKNKGASLGKMALGLKVINSQNGAYIGYWQAFGREVVGKMLSSIIFMAGYLMVVFRDDKKGLHDLLFSTQVIDSEE